MAENNTTFALLNTTVLEPCPTSVAVMYLVTSLLVMFSNSIVMAVVVTSNELHLPTLWNIAFMALCDFSFGLHYLVFAVPSAFMNRFAYPERFIVLSSCILTLLFGQNVLNIAVATVDRYLSVCWPLRYPHLMTPKRFIVAIVITVVINVCRLCLIVVPRADVYYNPPLALTMSHFATPVIAAAAVGLPFVIVIVISGFLLKLVCEMANDRRRVHSSAIDSTVHQFTFTICLSAGLFCLSYLPSCINIIWCFLAGKPKSVPIGSSRFGVFCVLSNSLWNCVIYALTYKPFRDAFLRLFCKVYYRKKRQMEVQSIFLNARGQD